MVRIRILTRILFNPLRRCRLNQASLRLCFGRIILASLVLAIAVGLWMAETHRQASLIRQKERDLHHFRESRFLEFYLDYVNVLIEPSVFPCEETMQVPLAVMVTSSPSHREQRDTIRQTWGKHFPTIFFIGLALNDANIQLAENYRESKFHSDLVVFDFLDHYQNLTLKTALMLKWNMKRCPQAEFLLKTDDDVLVNPWTMQKILKEHKTSQLVGYKIKNASPHRSGGSKWYIPEWLYPEDVFGEYLTGPGYLINGKYVEAIMKTALQVPMINLEDVYFTSLVANRCLNLSLTHERRLSQWKPMFSLRCAYFDLALMHSMTPGEMRKAWSYLEDLGNSLGSGEELCGLYRKYLIENWFLY